VAFIEKECKFYLGKWIFSRRSVTDKEKKRQLNVDVKTNQKGIPKTVPGKEGAVLGITKNEAKLKLF